MQNTEYTNEWVNFVDISKTIVITENHETSDKQLSEGSLSNNNSELQGKLSQLIQNFNKIIIKEIDPTVLSNEREKLLFEEGFNRMVDEINDLIFKLNNKGIEKEFEKQKIIEYLNNNNINSQEIYNWLLYNQNGSNAIFLLGYFNYYGIITSENEKKAFNLLIDATEKNHILAQYFVAFCYKDGYGTIKNEKLAFKYFEKVANKNYAMGQLEIGVCFKYGIGINEDSKKAFYWYEKAANNGNIIAMCNLGIRYENGDEVEEDYNKAFVLFKQSAEGGYLDGIVMLGYCYSNGVGTKIDKQKAFELYQHAANLGDDVAQNNLAVMYEKGDGITKDISKAIYWYEESAKQGYGLAKSNLKILENQYNL
jgi:TPR repeat protein